MDDLTEIELQKYQKDIDGEYSEIKEFCGRLPKIELQANLMCSLSKSIIEKLYDMRKKNDPTMVDFQNLSYLFEVPKSKEQNKQLLGLIKMLLDSQECLYEAIFDVIKQYNNDNTIYLELRPFVLSNLKTMTTEEFISYVIDCVCLAKTTYPRIVVKVIFAVGQSYVPKRFIKVCHLIAKYYNLYPEIVLGIDIFGEVFNSWILYKTLQDLKRSGLKIIIDCYKIDNYEELKQIIDFKPDRMNNLVDFNQFFGKYEILFYKLLQSYTPIEICLTFNIEMKVARPYSDFNLEFFYKNNHPISICAGRIGTLDTTLTKEYIIAAINLDLTKNHLFNLSLSSLMLSFCSEKEKLQMSEILREFQANEKLQM